MKLIGMLDSPYVRRVAVTLDLLGIAFEHEAVSVFSTFDRFRRINPVVKAPTLICDDGGILMDSALILQYIESSLGTPSPLWSTDPGQRLLQFRTVSFASAACDKSVQFVYETQLRPADAQHEPWKTRVRGQLRAAYAALETLAPENPATSGEDINHATVWSSVVWSFSQDLLPAEVPAESYPRLAQLARELEALPAFARHQPDGPGVPGLDAD